MILRRTLIALLSAFLIGLPGAVKAQDEPLPESWSGDEIVYARITTDMGNIDLALNKSKAPITVENFFAYAEKGYYDYTVIHRVVAGRLIQGGGYTRRLNPRPTLDPIENEATNGLDNLPRTIAMARQETDPHSAAGQWYINLRHNEELDHEGTDLRMQWGYAVFGRVVGGWDVVQEIAAVETHGEGPFDKDVPVESVTVTRVDMIEADAVGAE